MCAQKVGIVCAFKEIDSHTVKSDLAHDAKMVVRTWLCCVISMLVHTVIELLLLLKLC
jgi:hypothetical protein